MLLLIPDLGFKLNQKEIKEEFKILNNNILLKISGENLDILNLKAIEIINRLEKEVILALFILPVLTLF